MEKIKMSNKFMDGEQVPAVLILLLISFRSVRWFSVSLHLTGTRQSS
jgi:hypothetical protein